MQTRLFAVTEADFRTCFVDRADVTRVQPLQYKRATNQQAAPGPMCGQAMSTNSDRVADILAACTIVPIADRLPRHA